VTRDRGSDRLRGYLLGRADDTEASAIEREYFERDASGDRIADVEDALIEEYLEGAMTADDRGAFEQVYLASPRHRARVETIRQLKRVAAGTPRTRDAMRGVQPLSAPIAWAIGAVALAAAIFLAIVVQRSNTPTEPPRKNAGTAAVAPSPPAARGGASGASRGDTPASTPQRTFAVTLSPIAVRAAGGSSALVIPDGTTTVALDLESAGGPRFAGGRAEVRTVSGERVWEGPATAPQDSARTGVLARIEMPADRLRADDYIVTLFEGDAAAGAERARYSLRVRER